MRIKKGTILYNKSDSSECSVVSLGEDTFIALCKLGNDYKVKVFKYSDIGTILSFYKTELQLNKNKFLLNEKSKLVNSKPQPKNSKKSQYVKNNVELVNEYQIKNNTYFFYSDNVKRLEYSEKLEITNQISDTFKSSTHYKAVEENLIKIVKHTSKKDLHSNDSTYFFKTLLDYTFELIEFCLIKGHYLISIKLTRIISNEIFINHVYKYFYFWRYSLECESILNYLKSVTLHYEILSDEERMRAKTFGYIFNVFSLSSNDHSFKEINNEYSSKSRFDRSFYNYLNKLNAIVGLAPFIETTHKTVINTLKKRLSVRNINIIQNLLPIMLCNDFNPYKSSIYIHKKDLYNQIFDTIKCKEDMRDFFAGFDPEYYKIMNPSTITSTFETGGFEDQLTIVRVFIQYYINCDEPLSFSDFVSCYFSDYCSEYSSNVFKNLSAFLNINNYTDSLIQLHRKIIRLVTRDMEFDVSPTQINVNGKNMNGEEFKYSIKKQTNGYLLSQQSNGASIALESDSFFGLFIEHLFFQISMSNNCTDERRINIDTLLKLDKSSKIQILYDTIKDYRENEVKMSVFSVERWTNQFDKSEQDSLLNETIMLLDKMYFSKSKFQLGMEYFNDFLINYFNNKGESLDFYIINNQKIGSSQKDMVSLFHELRISKGMDTYKSAKSCNSKIYIYMDDGLYTGNRAKWEIKNFIIDNDLSNCTVLAFFMCAYEESVSYLRKSLNEFCISKKINLFVISYLLLKHKLTPIRENYSKVCEAFESRLEYERERDGNLNWPIYSLNNYPVVKDIFSLNNELRVFRKAALNIGLKLIENYNFTHFRPFGYTMFYNYGFGNVYVSYRNISNNSPLFLWFPRNDTFKWYPLFERKTNFSEQWHDLIEHTKRNLK